MKNLTVLESIEEVLTAFGYEVVNSGGPTAIKIKKNAAGPTVSNQAYLRDEKGKIEIANAPNHQVDGISTNDFLSFLAVNLGIDFRFS